MSPYRQHLKLRDVQREEEQRQYDQIYKQDDQTSMLSNDIRDRAINTYRKEIEGLQGRLRDYDVVKQKIFDLQRRKELLDDSTKAMQVDYEG